MRTALAQLHVPHHETRWWLSHSAVAIAVGALLVYAAAVLLVVAGVLLLT
ncbi:hypothetical protein BJ986_001142 [Phycicoccus badiiscoriae]|uniref:Uncharacterized protein n=1 Tax=Pedococcus badiiscoriae TaxID=642776 RepID=A0A852WK79_9MICO|nr:hypothetical protein [Pedococcus badiiscoriae]NYG06655.1 hypothetical protein [Pedococcus badiiscoriae]